MPKYHAEEIYDQAIEALGGEVVEFDQGGKDFTFPHPAFATDEWLQGLEDAGPGPEGNSRYLMGSEQYDKYVAAGGKAFTVMRILGKVNEASIDALADGTPTQSGISSRSTRRQSRRR